MSDPVDCPYCGKEVEIELSELNGSGDIMERESDVYTHACPHCEKEFGFSVAVIFHLSSHKAPCLNEAGGHDWHFNLNEDYPQVDNGVCKNCGVRIGAAEVHKLKGMEV